MVKECHSLKASSSNDGAITKPEFLVLESIPVMRPRNGHALFIECKKQSLPSHFSFALLTLWFSMRHVSSSPSSSSSSSSSAHSKRPNRYPSKQFNTENISNLSCQAKNIITQVSCQWRDCSVVLNSWNKLLQVSFIATLLCVIVL